MAKMHPAKLPESSNISYAERTLFETLQKGLSNSFSAYHSFHWTEATNTPREIDFIIFHPHKGFLVLEVKGGKILIDNGEWYTENKHGIHHIDDPFRQSQKSMYFLLDFYKKYSKQPFPGIASYAVCFPDTSPPAHAHPEMTQTNILFSHHLDKIESWVNRLYENPYYGYKNNAMNPEAAQTFNSILKPSIQIPLSIRSAIRQQRKELAQIDFFQDYLLDIFEDKKRVAIQGTAGTGKTWLAIKKAMRLVSQGKNCLFLCYNNLLSKGLKGISKQMLERTEGEKGRLDIFTFHSFSNHIFSDYIESIIEENDTQKALFFDAVNSFFPDNEIKAVKGFIGLLSNPNKNKVDRAGLQKAGGLDNRIVNLLDSLLTESEEGYFNFNVPMALLTLLEDNSYLAEKYDAILIDEGQDFEKTWCDCLAYFLENKRKRIVYIFYDDNQNIFMKKKQLPIIDLISKYNVNPYLYQLRKNIRNTKSIYDYATTQTNLGKTAHAVDVEGTKPYVLEVDSDKNARKQVGKIVHELLNEHSISNSQIVVLTDRSVSESVFNEHSEIGNYQLTETGKGASRNYIRLRSISRFKGLESDIVILVLHQAKEEKENRNELLYVGYTRAKFLLYVLTIT